MNSLSAEELAILESVELGEWQPVLNVNQEIERYRRYTETDQGGLLESVSFEIPAGDLQVLREVAEQSGIDVSLLMSALVHKFIVSHLNSH